MIRSLSLFSLFALFTHGALADNWANWRGPYHNGSSEEKNLPTEFSKDGAKWATEISGTGSSTPVVWEKSVFLTTTNEDEGGVMAMCLDADSGKVRWSEKFSEGVRQDDRSDYAGPSAVTDGKHVWFFSGNGDLAAYDFVGKQVWTRNIQKDYGEFAFGWTFSTSPALYDGILYMQVLQRDVPANGKGRADATNESYIVALKPETGEELWRHIRLSEAVMESREAFTTPIPILHDGRPELVVVGGDCLTGHNPKDGRELWRWGTWNPKKEPFWRLVPSPVYGSGIILACGPKGEPVYGIKAGGDGVLLDTAKAWASDDKEVSSDVPTPAYYDGYFYILNGRKKTLNCVHPNTGQVYWSERMDAKTKLESSPTAADGKIYVMSHLGEVFVFKAGTEPELLHSTVFGESQSVNIRASIVAANGGLYIRTDKALFFVKQ